MIRTRTLPAAGLTLLIALGAPLAAPPAEPTAEARTPLVRPIGPDTYALDRQQVIALFADPSPIRRQGWISPHGRSTTEGGLFVRDVIGLELHGIDKGSDLDRAGLRTGDIATHLDGTALTDIGSALGVGWRLRRRVEAGETTTTAVLLRAGRTITLTWRVVDGPGAAAKPAATKAPARPAEPPAKALAPPAPLPAAPPATPPPATPPTVDATPPAPPAPPRPERSLPRWR